MKVIVIGGTGLLGSEAVKVLLQQGHEICILAKNIHESSEHVPDQVKAIDIDLNTIEENQLQELMRAYDGIIFAAGVDERITVAPPIIEFFRKYNNKSLLKVIRNAAKVGIRRFVVCGSYFTYFARKYPQHRLAEEHPYIKSRMEQLEICQHEDFADLDIALVELPYIFGTQAGRKPVWVFLVEMLRNMPVFTFYPKGGTAMLTAKQVGRALVDALLNNRGRKIYPVASSNMRWKEMLNIFHEEMGLKGRKIITVPESLFRIATKRIKAQQVKDGVESGLDLPRFAHFMCQEAFIPLEEVTLNLGDDDIIAAIRDSVRQSVEFLKGTKMTETKP